LKAAVAHPITAHGPPPKVPSPSPGFEERATHQAEGKEKLSEAEPEPRPTKKPTTLKKRFWKDVDFQIKQGISAILHPLPPFFF
jgi:ATP synthase F1 complex assembly factor 2